jgi:putative peptidoglycan lipid II flippase
MIFICVAAVLMAALNARGVFDAPAFAPVLLNIVWIAAILLFVPIFTDRAVLPWGGDTAEGQVMAMSAAIVVGGVFQLLILLPALKRLGGSIAPARSSGAPEVARVWERFTPVVFGLGITQVNIVLDRVIAEVFVHGSGAVSALYFGNRLMQFPLAIVGIAVGTAAFPAFASLAVAGRSRALLATYRAARRVVLWVGLPAGVGLAVLAEPIVRVLFERGSFDAEATRRTAQVLLWYAATVPLISISQIQTRLLHAFGDTRTPVRVGAWSVLVNISANLVFVHLLDERGLALATSLSAAFTVWMLGRAVARTHPEAQAGMGAGFQALVAGLTAVMGGVCIYLVYATTPATGLAGLGQLVGYVFAALAVYFGGSRMVAIQDYLHLTNELEPPPKPPPAPPNTDSGDAWETDP